MASGDNSTESVTNLLLRWRSGSSEALDELIPLVYGELRRLAQFHLNRERAEHSLQATALTHEVFLRLFGVQRVEWQDRAHFFAMTSRLMRRILVDTARKRNANKRRGATRPLTLTDGLARSEPLDVDVIALHDALTKLADKDERQSRIVELRFFGGLSNEETAEALDISIATVKRNWRVAKLWLRRELASTAT